MGAWIETCVLCLVIQLLLVASYVGAWIETLFCHISMIREMMSHPTWVRGLKHSNAGGASSGSSVASYVGAWIETRLYSQLKDVIIVASYVGAWIETWTLCLLPATSASHPTWVRGLKLRKVRQKRKQQKVASYVGAWIETRNRESIRMIWTVASYVGAWIETFKPGLSELKVSESHPTWVRGLKLSSLVYQNSKFRVASYVGAWIETIVF